MSPEACFPSHSVKLLRSSNSHFSLQFMRLQAIARGHMLQLLLNQPFNNLDDYDYYDCYNRHIP